MIHKRSFAGVTTACALGLLLMGSTAHADDLSAPPQVTVRFADLNLAVPEGAERLYSRIRGAAMLVCGPDGDRNLEASRSRRACIKKAIADAVSSIDNAQLKAVYEAHQGRANTTRIAAVE